MVSSDFRAEARKKLQGKWGKAICIILAYFLVFLAIGFISGLLGEAMESLVSIVVTIIEIPLAFGFIISLVKLFNEQEVKAFDFFNNGFSNFKKSWGIALHTLLKMLVPFILLIVSIVLITTALSIDITSLAMSSMYGTPSGSSSTIFYVLGFVLLLVSGIWATTKSYYYKLAYIIAAENPELTGKEAVLKSEELMKNNRAKLFFLELSFIGWAILSVFTFGIGLLWLAPYIQFSTISFYKHLANPNVITEE